MEAVELILDAGITFDCIEESLLHAISKGAAKLVRVIIEHPNYIAGASRGGASAASGPSATSAATGTPTSATYNRRATRRGAEGQIAPPLLPTSSRDPFFRTDEKSQFSPDITPLILAAHYNNHEIVQMFLSRGHTIERPHPISCRCADCVTKQNYDSLKRSRSRLNAYRALASPAYMALSSPDPIMTTFELRQEMKKLAQVEKEFKVRQTGVLYR
jgi:ankyrin repeat protein